MSFDYIIKTSFVYIIKTSFDYIIKTSFVYIIKTSFVYIMLRTRCHLEDVCFSSGLPSEHVVGTGCKPGTILSQRAAL